MLVKYLHKLAILLFKNKNIKTTKTFFKSFFLLLLLIIFDYLEYVEIILKKCWQHHLCLISSLLGRIAGLSIAGKAKEIHSVPYFWTVQYGKSIRYTGRIVSMISCHALKTI